MANQCFCQANTSTDTDFLVILTPACWEVRQHCLRTFLHSASLHNLQVLGLTEPAAMGKHAVLFWESWTWRQLKQRLYGEWKKSCVFFPGCPVSPWKEPIQTRVARGAFMSLLSFGGPFRYCGDSKEWQWGVQGLIHRRGTMRSSHCPASSSAGLPQGYPGAGGISHPPDYKGRLHDSKPQASCVYIFV